MAPQDVAGESRSCFSRRQGTASCRDAGVQTDADPHYKQRAPSALTLPIEARKVYQKPWDRARRAHKKWSNEAFAALDQDGDNMLRRSALRGPIFHGLMRNCLGDRLPLPEDYDSLVDFVMQQADKDGDGRLSPEEFEAFTWRFKRMEADIDLEVDFVFAMFDKDGDGCIDAGEFQPLFDFQSGGGLIASNKEYIERTMAGIDEDGDHRISPKEYKQFASALNEIRVRPLTVTVSGATGLRSPSKWAPDPDVYCTVEVEGQTRERLRTPVARDTLNPMWNYEGDLLGYVAGNSLVFQLWDMSAEDRLLGSTTLASEAFDGSSLVDARLPLSGAGDVSEGTLIVSVRQFAAAHIASTHAAEDDGEERAEEAPPPQIQLARYATAPAMSAPAVEKSRDVCRAGKVWRKLANKERLAHRDWAGAVFDALDNNEDGYLERCELQGRMFRDRMRDCIGKSVPMPGDMEVLVDFVMKKADRDGDGRLSIDEFESFTWQFKRMEADIDLEVDFIFSLFDTDQDGTIDQNEFETVFDYHSGGGLVASNKDYIKKTMGDLDDDGDGKITPHDYVKWSLGLSKNPFHTESPYHG